MPLISWTSKITTIVDICTDKVKILMPHNSMDPRFALKLTKAASLRPYFRIYKLQSQHPQGKSRKNEKDAWLHQGSS
ncbi:hypothetical protein QVD17_18373 [Tagetes erecta]|uniref:Uncharacterized protein n=1 Tax=Tagetes erecta TaxID=13708 RepID=A0AAD8NW78_TARER|nr:hypothetical protein QVD17_18373 [Tagetes erecta]